MKVVEQLSVACWRRASDGHLISEERRISASSLRHRHWSLYTISLALRYSAILCDTLRYSAILCDTLRCRLCKGSGNDTDSWLEKKSSIRTHWSVPNTSFIIKKNKKKQSTLPSRSLFCRRLFSYYPLFPDLWLVSITLLSLHSIDFIGAYSTLITTELL